MPGWPHDQIPLHTPSRPEQPERRVARRRAPARAASQVALPGPLGRPVIITVPLALPEGRAHSGRPTAPSARRGEARRGKQGGCARPGQTPRDRWAPGGWERRASKPPRSNEPPARRLKPPHTSGRQAGRRAGAHLSRSLSRSPRPRSSRSRSLVRSPSSRGSEAARLRLRSFLSLSLPPPRSSPSLLRSRSPSRRRRSLW